MTEDQHATLRAAIAKPSYEPEDWAFTTGSATNTGDSKITVFFKYAGASNDQMRYLEHGEAKRAAQKLFRQISGQELKTYTPTSADRALWSVISRERKFTFVIADRIGRQQAGALMDADTAMEVLASDPNQTADQIMAAMAARLGLSWPRATPAASEDEGEDEEMTRLLADAGLYDSVAEQINQ